MRAAARSSAARTGAATVAAWPIPFGPRQLQGVQSALLEALGQLAHGGVAAGAHVLDDRAGGALGRLGELGNAARECRQLTSGSRGRGR